MDKTSLRLRKLWSPHAESLPRTRAPFTHTQRVSPARELHLRTRGGPPRFKGYSEFVISIHFCYLGRENLLLRPSPPSSGREKHLPRPSHSSSGRESDVRRPHQWFKRKLMVIISKKSSFYREVTFKAKEYIQKYKYLKIIKSLLHDLLHPQFLNI